MQTGTGQALAIGVFPGRGQEPFLFNGFVSFGNDVDDNSEMPLYQKYQQDLSRFKLLTAEQELDLGKRWMEERDMAARQTMINHNLSLVVHLAKKFRGKGMTFLDLIQEGNIALIKAVDAYDYRLGYRFSTYAMKCIKRCIYRSLQDHASTIYIPANIWAAVAKIRKAQAEFKKNSFLEPTVEQISALAGLKTSKIRKTLYVCRTMLHLTDLDYKPPKQTKNVTAYSLADLVKSGSAPPDFPTNARSLLQNYTDQLQSLLEKTGDGRNRQMLASYLGLDNPIYRQRKLAEVAQIYGISVEGVRKNTVASCKKAQASIKEFRRIRDVIRTTVEALGIEYCPVFKQNKLVV